MVAYRNPEQLVASENFPFDFIELIQSGSLDRRPDHAAGIGPHLAYFVRSNADQIDRHHMPNIGILNPMILMGV
jgi:hypothetical protein